MIRIARRELDAAVQSLLDCAKTASDVSGYRIVFELNIRQAEAAILGALSIATAQGPVTPSDVVYSCGDVTFPPLAKIKRVA